MCTYNTSHHFYAFTHITLHLFCIYTCIAHTKYFLTPDDAMHIDRRKLGLQYYFLFFIQKFKASLEQYFYIF